MPSTTLKLPEPLKARIAPLAAAAGQTPHAWMVAALSEQAELAERRERFVRDALVAAAEVDANGEVFAASEVHDYLRARLAGQTAARPQARKR